MKEMKNKIPRNFLCLDGVLLVDLEDVGAYAGNRVRVFRNQCGYLVHNNDCRTNRETYFYVPLGFLKNPGAFRLENIEQ